MKRLTSYIVLAFAVLAALVLLAPSPAARAQGPVYAAQVSSTFGTVQNTSAALGAPNGSYATINTDGGIALGMGGLVGGTVTIYHSSTSPACAVMVGLTDGTSQALGTTNAGATSTLFQAPSTNFDQVGVRCNILAKKAVFQLDAVQVGGTVITPTGYGVLLYTMSGTVQNVGSALGAPNGSYATINANSQLVLSMGGSVGGTVTIYHSNASPACQVTVFLANGAPQILGNTSVGATSTIFPAPSTNLNLVSVACGTLADRAAFQLDAVQVGGTVMTPTGYGVVIYMTTGTVQNASAALGAPNGSYATINAYSRLFLSMGGTVGGTVTIYHSSASPACAALAVPPGGGLLDLGDTTAGATSTVFPAPSTNFDQVVIECNTLAKKATFQLDAVQVGAP